MDRFTLILTQDEIRDTRMALVQFAQSYTDLSRNPDFSRSTRLMMAAEAMNALAVADKITHVITRQTALAIGGH